MRKKGVKPCLERKNSNQVKYIAIQMGRRKMPMGPIFRKLDLIEMKYRNAIHSSTGSELGHQKTEKAQG